MLTNYLFYAYYNNNPVNLIDPDGREASPPRSRIEYRGNGVFGLNVNNLNSGTRSGLNRANQDPKNWTINSQTGQRDIGISTTVATINIQQPSRPSTVGVDPQHTTTSVVRETSGGHPYRTVEKPVVF